jgi:hypothetical protein
MAITLKRAESTVQLELHNRAELSDTNFFPGRFIEKGHPRFINVQNLNEIVIPHLTDKPISDRDTPLPCRQVGYQPFQVFQRNALAFAHNLDIKCAVYEKSNSTKKCANHRIRPFGDNVERIGFIHAREAALCMNCSGNVDDL